MNAAPIAAVKRVPAGIALSRAAEALNLPLSPEQEHRLLEYVELLSRWNRTYNLTSIRDPREMLTHHIVDCLAAVAPLRRQLATMAPPSPAVLDVGSGGGLPGVVFAITDPGFEVTCVDSVGKKVAFLRQAAASLSLPNLKAKQARVEDLDGAQRYDFVVARAFASLAVLAGGTARLLAANGVWMAMKGKTPDDEVAALPSNVEVFHVERLDVPELDAERCLIWMRAI